MKGFKKLMLAFAVVAVALLPNRNALTVSAEEPATYYVKYMADSDSWRTQKSNVWDSTKENYDLNFVTNNLKDGDLLVVEGDGVKDFTYNLNIRPNNVTVKSVGRAVISAGKGIENCFVLRGSVAAINGDINNAYVYDNAFCNLNNNIKNLYLVGESKLEATVVVVGSVSYAKFTEGGNTLYELYNFAANSFRTENGILRTDSSKYSHEAPAAQPAPAPAPTPAPEQPSAGQQSTVQPGTQQNTQQQSTIQPNTNADDEYDEVPRTGEGNGILWLTLIGISLLLTGSYTYQKCK